MAEIRQVFEFTGDDETVKSKVDWEAVEEKVNLTSGDAINKRCKEIIATTATAVFFSDDHMGPDDIIGIFSNLEDQENVRKIAGIVHKILGIIYFQLFEGSTTFPAITYVVNKDSPDAVPGEPIVFADEEPEMGARIRCIINASSILEALRVEPSEDTAFDSAEQRIARAVLKAAVDTQALNTNQLLPLVILRLICEHAMIHLIQIINGGVVASTQSMFCHNPATTFLGHSTSVDLNQMLSSQISFTLTQEERRPVHMLHMLNK